MTFPYSSTPAHPLDEVLDTLAFARQAYVAFADTSMYPASAKPANNGKQNWLFGNSSGSNYIVQGVNSLNISVHPAHMVKVAPNVLRPHIIDASERLWSYIRNAEKNNTPGAFARTVETEFLRHLRNAAGHDNHWNFVPSEPRLVGVLAPAFGHVTLANNMSGTGPVLIGGTQAVTSFSLRPGDVLALLWEVEQQICLHLGVAPHVW